MDKEAARQQVEAQSDARQKRIDTLNALAWEVGASDPRRALALSQEAYDLAQHDGVESYAGGLLASLIGLGRFHYELSHLDQAQAYLEEALTLAQEQTVEEGATGTIRMGMGLVCWRLGDYATALEHLLAALELSRNAGDKGKEANLLSNIGMVYGVTGEYRHAMDVYRQAFAIYKGNQHHNGYGMALNNMAMVCLQADEYTQALDYAGRSLNIARETGHRAMETNALDSAGAAYMGLGCLDEAYSHFQASATLAAELGDRHDELAAWIHVGQLHARKNETERARDALQRALALAQTLGDTELIRQCHQELAKLFKEQGDFVRALAHYEQYHEADRAIYSERAAMRFKTLQVVHETETARQEAKLSRLRNASLEQEIAERRRVEAALRESEGRFRLLMEESPIGVQVYAADGTLLHTNQTWRDMWDFGQGASEEHLNLLQSRLPDMLGIRDSVQQAFSGESIRLPDLEFDPERIGLQGTPRWLRTRAYSLMGMDDELRNVVLLIEDITEQKRTEEALRAAQKVESLGALAGGVAHDFNNLLVAMLGQASLALNLLRDEHPARSHVQKTVSAAEQASTLTQQMLAYSGRGHFTIRPLDLNALIEEHLHMWHAATSHRVQLQLDLAPSLPAVEADAGQIQQMLLNLILNGAEAMGQVAGCIVVRTSLMELSGSETRYWHYTGRPLEPGAYLRLEVSDEAAGIAPQNLSHIFDPFFTTKEQGKGLGLAAVLGIVRGHKAGLAVRSSSTGGTTFEILFPVSARVVSTGRRAASRAESGAVLVIDDEEMVREAVTDILVLEEIAVLAAEDGYHGLELYRRHASDVELVLLDLSMPGISGEETYRRLRQIDPDVRVVLSSGYSAGDVALRFYDEGPVGFLQKPYSVMTLLDEVHKYLRN